MTGGVRSHVLVLPSVVCSTHAASAIADGSAGVAITHQHGCLHVGDDLKSTEGALIGIATNPNVAAVVVVSLGCETIQGKRLAHRIRERGQRVEFVGIQAEGGTARAVEVGIEAVGALAAEIDAPAVLGVSDLKVGVDGEDAVAVGDVATALRVRGVEVLLEDELTGAMAHTALAARGAHAIVSLVGPQGAPTGFAVCPVIAVSQDPDLYLALEDDFDLGPSSGDEIADVVLAACAGERTAAERRGAQDFVLHRLAMTM